MSAAALYDELRARLTAGLTTLPDKPEETADSTLRALWFTAAGTPKSAESASRAELPMLDQRSESELRASIERRLSGIPLAHITGRQQFMGIEMLAGPEALIPRKETELLVRAAVEIAAEAVEKRGRATMVDTCTGSGNIALTVAQLAPGTRVFAADISEDSLDLARRNARFLGLENHVEYFNGDLLTPFDTPEFHNAVDLLTCNPPYINSAKVKQMPREVSAHEPRLAFDGGLFGVAIIIRLINEAPRLLRQGGWLAAEIGLRQGPVLGKLLKKNPAYEEVRMLKDETGAVRAIMARCR